MLSKTDVLMIVCILLAVALLYEHFMFRTLVDGQIASMTPAKCYELIYGKQLNSTLPFRIAP